MRVASERVEGLLVTVSSDEGAMAEAAAAAAEQVLREAIASRGRAVMIAAAGQSQVALLARLASARSISWSDVSVFQLDEYVGVAPDAPASFASFVRRHLVDAVEPGAVELIDGAAGDPEREARRYEALLRERPADLCLLGVGENAHLAFNEPGAADFGEGAWVDVVDLAPETIRQHERQGLFPAGSVPRRGITVTIPAILASRRIVAVAPEARKAEAVRCAVRGPVSPDCPASALRRATDAHLFLDPDSAALLNPRS